MGLFIISFLMVLISSYLTTSVLLPKDTDTEKQARFAHKKSPLGFNYFFLISFAQIILTFEVLSLFSAINQPFVLALNLIFLIASIFIWQKKAKPLWTVDLKSFRNRMRNSFKLDKSLAVLFFGFCIFIITTIILCLIMPITNMDALGYHVARSLFWVLNGNLNHFEVADIRNLCLPINSEILYSWILLFIRKDFFLGFFAFFGYLLSIFSVYNILGLIGLCTRKKLWTIFILSSFASVIVQASGTETDIIIAGLVTTSVFLFWHSLKHNEKTPLYMSALAYAIAIGTKTTAIIAIPGVAVLFIALSIKFKNKEFYKPLLTFFVAGLITFLIFSSYNYILNYIHFKDIFGAESLMEATKNYYGLKAIPANFIKYMFLFFDFTGFKWSDYVGHDITQARNILLNNLNLGLIKDGLYSPVKDPNRTLIEPIMGAGVLGLLAFIPCLAWSLIKPIFKPKSKKTWILFGFGCIFIINLITMSYLISFMIFSIRFVMFFMVLSAPILAYSYLKSKNPLKYLIIAFSLFYLIGVSTHIWARPLNKTIRLLIKNPSISELRQQAACNNFEAKTDYIIDTCILVDKIKRSYSTTNKILIFPHSGDNIFLINQLIFEGYDIDLGLMEDVKKINFDDYNIVISTNVGQKSTYIKDYEKRKDEVKPTPNGFTFSKDISVPCIYIPNKLRPTPENDNRAYPYTVLCRFTDKFTVAKNLKLINSVGILFKSKPEQNYYTIYENNNNLIKYNDYFEQKPDIYTLP